MKKLFKFLPMLLMVALLAGFASCSKDDDGEADLEGAVSKGKMTGWIKIDDKKYDLKYCWNLPDDDSMDNEYSFVAASKDIDSKKLIKDRFDFATISIGNNYQGIMSLDLEFLTGFSYFDEGGYVGYYLDVPVGENVVIEKSGDSFKIVADNVTIYQYNEQDQIVGTHTCSLSFNGKPADFKNVTIE